MQHQESNQHYIRPRQHQSASLARAQPYRVLEELASGHTAGRGHHQQQGAQNDRLHLEDFSFRVFVWNEQVTILESEGNASGL